jgi:arylsulfatase A-like enzyme
MHFRLFASITFWFTTLIGAPIFAAETKPNIIFILADDLGACDLGCTGSTFYETPHLDPPRTGITDYIGGYRSARLLPAPNATHLALNEMTIAEALKKAGYVTGHIGKWHLGGTGFFPNQQGFDTNIGGCAAGHPPSYFSPYKISTLPNGPAGEYLTDRLAAECEKFIETNKDHPFYLNLWPYAVHSPLQAKPELVKKYEAKLAKLPAPGPGDFRREGECLDRRVQNRAVYAAMMESLDDNVGRIMAKLSALGLDQRTIIVFTSDNGGLSTSENSPTSNAPFRAGKGWLYEGGVREPLLVKWPGLTKRGSLCHTPVITMDFYPTFLTAAGLPQRPEQHRDGVDLSPLLKGGSLAERALFWHYPHYGNQFGQPGSAIRLGDWKLIEWLDSERTELFNLKNDIEELHDLAAKKPDKVKELQARLNAWRRDVGAVMPTLNPDWNKQPAAKKPSSKKKSALPTAAQRK